MRNLLELKYSENSALLMLLMLLQCASYILWCHYSLQHPIYQQFVNPATVSYVVPVLLGSMAVAVLWIVLCLIKRSALNWQMPLSIGAATIFLLVMMFAGYVSGLLAMSLGVVLASAPMIGILMLPARLVLWEVGIGGAFLCALAYASVAGYLPYAPLFKEQLISKSVAYGQFYFWSEVYFVMPFLLVVMTVAHQFLRQWRIREAQIRKMSQTDALTGLYNRRTVHDQLVRLVTQSKTSVAVILIDLDHFKLVNDQHGHLNGDRLLKHVSNLLLTAFPNAYVARFGGEEFLIVLEGVESKKVQQMAEECRRYFVQNPVVLSDSTISFSGSFGVMLADSPQSFTADLLLSRADEALYHAKDQGRNCVVIADEMLQAKVLHHPATKWNVDPISSTEC